MAEPGTKRSLRFNADEFVERHQSGFFDEPLEATTLEIDGCANHDWLAGGWRQPISLVFRGKLGDFCLNAVSDVECSVKGNVGHNFANAMVSGIVRIFGDAGDGLMSFARGGVVVMKGSAGRRVGCGLDGGDAIVAGSVGLQAAFEMRSGNLIVGGDAGPMLGLGAKGGTIYVSGKVSSVASSVEEDRMRDADRLKLSLLLLKAGLEFPSTSWRVFRVVNE